MAVRKFHFGPQPALDRAVARQSECEKALVAAREVLARERDKLEAIAGRIAEIRQQIADELDKISAEMRSPIAASSVQARQGYVDGLRRREARQLHAKQEQEEQVRWAVQMLEVRRSELAESMNEVMALEKAKERAHTEFKARLRKAEEKERDDIAISRGVKKRPPS
ncbi:MAG: flagellar export protein FliJ [Phycisphaerae bacterium]